MANRISVEIKPIDERNIGDLVRMKEQFHWNQTSDDIKNILKVTPDGSFAAYIDGNMVGTITTIKYGLDLAWIGMMMVDPNHRRRGIASRLMETALKYLDASGVKEVKLDATPEGYPLYESFGFIPECSIERWECNSVTGMRKVSESLDESEFPALRELDRIAFGADRWTLLNILAKGSDPLITPMVSKSKSGKLDGYAFARRGSNAWYAGPIVAATQDAAISLLNTIMACLRNEKLYIDYNTGFKLDPAFFPSCGFKKQRELTRMCLGKSGKTSDIVFGIAGPELG